MVTRKPVPSRSTEQPLSAPYPTSPKAPSAPDHQASANVEASRSRSSSVSSHDTWNSGFSSDHEEEKSTAQPKTPHSDIPASLRVGNPSFQSHNPYHNLHTPASTQSQSHSLPYPADDSRPIWAPNAPPPPPPSQPAPSLAPVEPFAALSISNHQVGTLEPPAPDIPQKSSRRSLVLQASSSNPWQYDLDREQHMQNPWKSTPSPQPDSSFQPPSSSPPLKPSPSPHVPALSPNPQPSPSLSPSPASLAFNAPNAAPPAPPVAHVSQQSNPPVYTNLSPTTPPVARTSEQPEASSPNPPEPSLSDQSEPLIDFGTQDTLSPQASQPDLINATQPERSTNPAAPIESAEELLKAQRNETYQIKMINWSDATGTMRRCPILTQNANGPCPLLALVNALVLSGPESPRTILVDTLGSREHISLGLLLDAVFEELARRTEISTKALPDVGELYSFLITLHTGMNVNPRFVALPNAPQGSPGSFDETREMRLYSAFDLPLVHGWLPHPTSSAYEAFDRSAKTFDDALNIQFAQSELEHKLGTDGLTANEQQMFEDIIFIKEFLTAYPTQLTEHGLDVIVNSFKPGQVAILFRNDHFSTLYKHPRTNTLMNLVTDAGYSSHEEIVWESLVDVTGAAGGFFSGDFRPVGNTPPGAHNSGHDWQTRNKRNSQTDFNNSTFDGPSTSFPAGSEQEDADLALALQLQEEEEDSQRRSQAARRQQEDELSRQFLERESVSSAQRPPSSEQRPAVPPRRGTLGNNSHSNPNPSHNRPPPTTDAPYIRETDDGDEEPPSYEQAASDRPFRPPGTTREPRQGDALGALTALQMQQGPFANHNGMGPQAPLHRRRSSAMGGNNINNSSPRLRRQQSQAQSHHPVMAAPQATPQYSGYMPPGTGGRISQAEREERCIVM